MKRLSGIDAFQRGAKLAGGKSAAAAVERILSRPTATNKLPSVAGKLPLSPSEGERAGVRGSAEAQLLAENSDHLAKTDPALIAEIEASGHLRRRKSAASIRNDLLRDGLSGCRKEIVRIVLRDLLNQSDAEQTQIELTALADIVLQIAAPEDCAIIGLGRLGGQELLYGDELHIFCINGKPGSLRETGFRVRAETKLPNPKRATVADSMALSRARFIAGDREVANDFLSTAKRLSDYSAKPPQENWLQEVHRLRLRLEHEHTRPEDQPFAIRDGTGGLADAEFTAQTLCLENGWHHPNTLRALARAAAEKVAPAAALATLSDSYRKLREIERAYRRCKFPADTILTREFADRCGQPTADTLLAEISSTRSAMRAAFDEINASLTAQRLHPAEISPRFRS